MILKFVISALIVQATTGSLMTEDQINDFFHKMISCAYERGSEIINKKCLPETVLPVNSDFQRESRSRRRRDIFLSDEEDDQIDICHYEKCSRQSLFININVSFIFYPFCSILFYSGYRRSYRLSRGDAKTPRKKSSYQRNSRWAYWRSPNLTWCWYLLWLLSYDIAAALWSRVSQTFTNC